MQRKRLKFVKVTNSPLQASEVKVGSSFGKPAKIRHNVNYDGFRGVKIPKSIGICVLGDLAQLLVR